MPDGTPGPGQEGEHRIPPGSKENPIGEGAQSRGGPSPSRLENPQAEGSGHGEDEHLRETDKAAAGGVNPKEYAEGVFNSLPEKSRSAFDAQSVSDFQRLLELNAIGITQELSDEQEQQLAAEMDMMRQKLIQKAESNPEFERVLKTPISGKEGTGGEPSRLWDIVSPPKPKEQEGESPEQVSEPDQPKVEMDEQTLQAEYVRIVPEETRKKINETFTNDDERKGYEDAVKGLIKFQNEHPFGSALSADDIVELQALMSKVGEHPEIEAELKDKLKVFEPKEEELKAADPSSDAEVQKHVEEQKELNAKVKAILDDPNLNDADRARLAAEAMRHAREHADEHHAEHYEQQSPWRHALTALAVLVLLTVGAQYLTASMVTGDGKKGGH